MTKRLFLGISLNKRQTEQIQQLQSKLPADIKLVSTTNLHMTLAFLGPVSALQQRQIEKQISVMNKPKFCITLDTLAYWKKPKVLCLKGKADDQALLHLAQKCSFLIPSPQNKNEPVYLPHITLARKAKHAVKLIIKPLVIQAEVMHLFESKSSSEGVKYQILRSWDLH